MVTETSKEKILEGIIEEALNKLPPIIEGLNDSQQQEYSRQLQILQKRFHDPEFRLAIIGNFSSGKSTFFNALLDRELLSVSDLPTTAIPTYIRWNRADMVQTPGCEKGDQNDGSPIIKIIMEDDSDYILAEDGIKQFQRDTGISVPHNIGNLLDYITTTSSLIGKIKKIEVSFPERSGFKNFCLIDTPGVNPGDEASKGHIVQTQLVLKAEADAAVILYTAKDAMSKDTREFMEDHGLHLMSDAIVVLTKMDLVPERQVEKVIRNTTRLIREQFHQTNPCVYHISAGEALEYKMGREPGSKIWAEQFDKTVMDIMSQLRVRRNTIISSRMAALMTKLIDQLSDIITAEHERLKKEKYLIEQASVEKLETEFESVYKNYVNQMSVQTQSCFGKMKDIVHQSVQVRCDQICGEIGQASNQKKLNWCLKEYYNNTMKGADTEIVKKVNDTIMPQINKINAEYAQKVEACLEKYNRHLGKLDSRSVSVKSGIITATSFSKTQVSSSFLENHVAFLATAGAAFFIPGLNILLVAGLLFDAVRFHSKKEEAQSDVRRNLENYETELIESCKQSLSRTEQQNRNWAKNLLSNYKKKYQTSFNQAEQIYHQHKIQVEARLTLNEQNSVIIGEISERLSELNL